MLFDKKSSPGCFAKIPATIESLELDIDGALVTISHEDRSDIGVTANYPGNWNVENGSVQQIKVQQPLGGSNGDSFTSISGSFICRNSSFNGKKVAYSEEPDRKGSSSGPDKLDILVPNSFRGGLSLNYRNGSEVQLDSWQGGNVLLTGKGRGDLDAGRLIGLESFVLQSAGAGDVVIATIQTKSFRVLRKGRGDLDIGELNTESLSLQQAGRGDTSVRRGSAVSGSLISTGSGDISMRGSFGNISQRSNGSGNIEIRVGK